MPQFLVTALSTDAPKPLSSVPKTYRTASIIACKGLDGPTASPNANTVFIGRSASASEQPIEMQPGDERSFSAPANGRRDLATLFLKVTTSGDGIVVEYE